MTITTKDKSDMVKYAAQKHFLPYAIAIDPDDEYDINWHHKIIANKLESIFERVQRREKVRVMFLLPPRHSKTDTVTIKFPTWALGKNPKLEVISSSYSLDIAMDRGLKARDIMLDLNYQRIFKTRLRQDSKAKGRWLTPQGGGYTSVGIGGPITGRGFNIGIIDDPIKNREEAESETYRDMHWNWYLSTFYTRQTKGYGAIIIIVTRWHTDDIVGRLLEKQKHDEQSGAKNYDQWEVVKIPAIAEEDEPPYRKKGEPIWPRFYNLDFLKNQENTLGIYEFASLYQQTPMPSEHLEFQKSYFRYFEEKDIRGKFLKIDITIDPAISKKKESANTAIVAKAKEEQQPEWYIVDYKVGKMDPGQIFDATYTMYFDLRRRFPNAEINVWIETIAYQEALMYIFQEQMKKKQEYFMVYELRDKGDKFARIRGLVPLYKLGVVYHAPWMREQELEKEALTFPKGKTVDILDALGFQLKLTRPTAKKSTYEQKPPPSTSIFAGTQRRE